ncbi:MAG: Spore cortex-lytic enzyme prepeptide [Caldanaerobacter subterraneus]|uniref:Spore cortex-lytic enzyme n=4 Tax=Caldanaerobacter subterraneus TaxID=911092 RepID=Q8R773_CALS4|nr:MULTISPECIES: spore cortex-lytic enzyme [Caldanaerobacter]AAM25675.1 spore cortex-lytic enzyme prepeptide [Caldanaerobacter subterraneus subsp. tengcongensis MB4]ERM91049.1 cell wall hydrolase [Caldanaerobacter subterraneus subsp. yonseiensis KB-1]KUK09079.1 MAG: Spore cortex-lytic enzyme prepeptide [Caldanaerobacter subterraneus]MCS3917447.1 N-acetylmuramoyl-L-alanine amidase [Caldanaerobacter subterraneus subsp. tengcongensis MB4]MDI3518545.1 N-acetylmuramoyl-L-alanine amidase [Caldanaero
MSFRVRFKVIIAILVVFTTAVFEYTAISMTKTAMSNLYWGNTGSDVAKVQARLKAWGYYDGPVDGFFGVKTWLAVRKFQAYNGLAVTGIVDDDTKVALGFTTTAQDLAAYRATSSAGISDDVYLLAMLINGEARGEPYIGKVAVGAVVMNRVRDPRFPKTIPGVIFQPGAFSAVEDGQMWLPPTEESIKAAIDAVSGWDPTGGALYYYNAARVTNYWIFTRPILTQIGRHIFAR